jgi:hypothetical protein
MRSWRLSRKIRASLVVVDQGFVSVIGFGLSVFALKVLSTSDFAIFSIVYSIYLFALLVTRALTGDVANLTPEPDRSATVRVAAGAALGLGLWGGLLVAVAGLLFHASVFVVLGVVFPALVGQDVLRWSALVLYRPAVAARLDGTWLGLFAAVVLVVTGLGDTGHLTLSDVFVIWGGSAFLSFAVGLLISPPLRPLLGGSVGWVRTNKSFGLMFSIEALGQNGLNVVATNALAVVAGLHQLAIVKASTLMFGPISLILQAGGAFLVGEAVSTGRNRRHINSLVRSSSLSYLSVIAVWTVLLLVAPTAVVDAAFGPTAVAARPLIPFVAIVMVLTALVQVRQSALRASDPRRAVVCRLAGAVAANLALIVGGAVAGAAGAMRLAVFGYAMAAIISQVGLAGALGPGRHAVVRHRPSQLARRV